MQPSDATQRARICESPQEAADLLLADRAADVERRKEEIESLQEALRILNGEDIA